MANRTDDHLSGIFYKGISSGFGGWASVQWFLSPF